MIVATLVVAVGLLAGIWIAYTRGLRLGGVVVVSLLAVYTLLNFAALPVFVLGALLAYVGIRVVQDRWLLYGRRLLIAAMLLGAVVPVVAFLFVEGFVGRSNAVHEVEFLGSILPGIAAYNFYRQDPERRVADALASAGLFVVLVVVGVAALGAWEGGTCWTCALFGVEPGEYVTPILLRMGSDAGAVLGLGLQPRQPVVGTLLTVAMVVVFGLILAEFVRFRWGLRPIGVVAVPLLVLFALRAWWILPMYLAILTMAYVGTRVIHAETLFYGRALLSFATVMGVLLALPVLVAFDLRYGLLVFFAGLLAGIGAYNFHVVPPRERRAALAVNAGLFVVVFGGARILVAPLPGGLAETVTLGHVVVVALVLGVAAWTILGLERLLPANRAIHDASPFGREVVEE